MTVTNPGAKSGTVGTAITPFTLTASRRHRRRTPGPATGLPPGLTIGSSTGTVSGTPTDGRHVHGDGHRDQQRPASGVDVVHLSRSPAAAATCASPGQKLGNPGFESGSAPWTGDRRRDRREHRHRAAPRTGTRKAWLDGYGTTHTDTLTQSVTHPGRLQRLTLSASSCTSTQRETTTTTAYDKLTVDVGHDDAGDVLQPQQGRGLRAEVVQRRGRSPGRP